MAPFLVASLLATTGLFHLVLAKPLFNSAFGRLELLLAGIVIFVTQNLLYVVFACAALELTRFAVQSNKRRAYDNF